MSASTFSAPSPLFPQLLEIDDPRPSDGPWHMAADEFLLHTMDQPTLRFFHWRSPQATFGYFLRHDDIVRKCPGWSITRRWTGGGVVRHGEDVTFSLVVPRGCSLSRQQGRLLYEKIHHCVALALSADAVGRFELVPDADSGKVSASDRSSDCFHAPVPADVLSQGRKVAGGAMRRTHAGVLYQGSIFESGITDQVLPRQRLQNGLRREFSPVMRVRSWTSGEQEVIENLARERYSSPAWNRRC